MAEPSSRDFDSPQNTQTLVVPTSFSCNRGGNYAWILFFLFMGGINLYVAYFYSTDVWVNFKLFGGAGLLLVFVFLQAIYLTRHLAIKQQTSFETVSKNKIEEKM